jgi:hypothetical protein
MAMSPPHPPKKYEQNQTGCLELSWREKINNELFPQLLGFLVTYPKIDNEPIRLFQTLLSSHLSLCS